MPPKKSLKKATTPKKSIAKSGSSKKQYGKYENGDFVTIKKTCEEYKGQTGVVVGGLESGDEIQVLFMRFDTLDMPHIRGDCCTILTPKKKEEFSKKVTQNASFVMDLLGLNKP